MKIYKFIFILFVTFNLALALKIEPIPKDATLRDMFSINCLQMTQSQQMLKAYILKGLNIKFKNPHDSLKEAIPAYDKRFKEIKEYFQSRLKGDKEAIEAFNQAEAIWIKSRAILEKKPTKEGVLKLRENFNQMIPLLLEGTKPSAKSGLELLSITGKLCRDPMRISIDYLLKIWGVNIPDYEEDVREIIDDFHTNLKKLKSNPLNNDKTLRLLDDIQKGFMVFEMMSNSNSCFVPNIISHNADENFKFIRRLKAEYKKNLQ